MKQMGLVLGTIGLLLVGLGVGFGLGHWGANPPPAAVVTTPTPTPTAVANTDFGFSATDSASPRQTIQDAGGLYSLQLPADWQVALDKADQLALSSLFAQSPDYRTKVTTPREGITNRFTYQAGIDLQVHVLNQPLSVDPQPAGAIAEQKDVVLDGARGTYFVFTNPATVSGQLLEVRLEKGGQTYQLRAGYNLENYPDGQAEFDRILSSFHFLRE